MLVGCRAEELAESGHGLRYDERSVLTSLVAPTVAASLRVRLNRSNEHT